MAKQCLGMVNNIRECGKMELSMGLENIFTVMGLFMKEVSLEEKKMERVNIFQEMEQYLKGYGRMERERGGGD